MAGGPRKSAPSRDEDSATDHKFLLSLAGVVVTAILLAAPAYYSKSLQLETLSTVNERMDTRDNEIKKQVEDLQRTLGTQRLEVENSLLKNQAATRDETFTRLEAIKTALNEIKERLILLEKAPIGKTH